MQGNKNALTYGKDNETNLGITYPNTSIILQKTSNNDVLKEMPIILSSMVELLANRHINIPINSILNMVLVKTAQMITAKRITLKEIENILYPNYYAICFMPSGFGKDRLLRDLKGRFFKSFGIWFVDKARDNKLQRLEKIKIDSKNNYNSEKEANAYVKEQENRLRELVIEISDGTLEGVFEDAQIFQEAKFGSIFTVINELGSYLKGISPVREQFLPFLYEAYDGVIPSKCIKGGKRQMSIENMPVNALLYSDHTLFKKDIKNMFENLMSIGLCRRSVVTFFRDNKLKDIQMTYDEEKRFFEQAELLNKELFNKFFSIDDNACYVLEEETKDKVLNEYSSHLTNLFNNTEDEMRKREIKSRELKALKLSCLYACFNHPANEYIINSTDMIQAIRTIEALSSDFKDFINYKPKQKDRYDHVFDFFLQNKGKYYTKSNLIANFSQFGFSRRKMQTEFNDIIAFVSDIAQNKGYYLLQEQINNKSGMNYCLKESLKNEKFKNAQNLTELI